MAKNPPYQNFPGIYSMIGSPERGKDQSSIPKIRKIHSCVWKLYVKNSQNSQFLQKIGQIFVLNGQSFAESEFSRHSECDFFKENYMKNMHTKNKEDSQRRLEVIGKKLSKLSILTKNGQILVLRRQGGQRGKNACFK